MKVKLEDSLPDVLRKRKVSESWFSDSGLNIGGITARNISRWEVFANNKCRFPVFWREDAIAQLGCTTELSSRFPHHLCKVRWLGVVRVVGTSFIGPGGNRRNKVVSTTGTGG